MAPKTTELSQAVRERVVVLREQGNSYREIAKTLKLNHTTVYKIVQKKNETGTAENKVRSGRPKLLNGTTVRAMLREVAKSPFISSQTLAEDIATTTGVVVTPKTVRNYLHKNEIRARAPRHKPYISEINRNKRLQFAKEYLNKSQEFWNSVIFSDESKFNLFGSDGKKCVWRKKNTALDRKNMKATVKHGGGHVMVWGCMAASGTGKMAIIDGIMNARGYIEILRHNLLESSTKLGLGETFVFQQDNDPKHRARLTEEWLLYNVRRRLHTPPQSPDLNPIEHMWAILDRKIRKRKFSNKNELALVIQEEWAKIDQNVTQNLVNSMPRRLQAVIDAKGLPTKY